MCENTLSNSSSGVRLKVLVEGEGWEGTSGSIEVSELKYDVQIGRFWCMLTAIKVTFGYQTTGTRRQQLITVFVRGGYPIISRRFRANRTGGSGGKWGGCKPPDGPAVMASPLLVRVIMVVSQRVILLDAVSVTET